MKHIVKTFRNISLVALLMFILPLYGQEKEKKVFEVKNPDYTLSPYTGMTRDHWIQAAEYILEGAFGYIKNLDDQMYFPKQLDKTYPRGKNDVAVAKLEGLARTLFVAAPLLRENPDLTLNGIKVADYYRHQLVNICNPNSNSYIPHRKGGPSQTLLELASLTISMQAAPDVLWNPLTQKQKDDLAATLLSYGEGPTIGSNWMFFNVFIMSFLKDQGYKVNEKYLKENLEKLLARYRGEGWYNDAPAYDYYSMWAYQTYGPFWAEMFGKKQFPELADQFFKYQSDLVDNYPYMFSEDGRMNMWGRSVCYRFASVSPLPLLEYGTNKHVNYGWMRRIASSTLLQFMQHPDFLMDGVPTMGFYGPFAPVVQIYSCRGSVYWCGKAFLGLLLPETSAYWSTKENNGPWEKELKKGNVYNKFQPATNLLITNYPNCGGSEMRSWCHETVANDWQKFRSSENYNKLAYHTEFPWMADSDKGHVSQNYAIKNQKGDWEVLRLYTFRTFSNGVYRRDAVLETDKNVKLQLADIPLENGILRIDKVTTSMPTDLRLGHYSLAEFDKAIEKNTLVDGENKVYTINNGKYQLAMISLAGWNEEMEYCTATGLHPEAEKSVVINATDNKEGGSKFYVTLQLWKKGDKAFTKKELNPVKKIQILSDGTMACVTLSNGETKYVLF